MICITETTKTTKTTKIDKDLILEIKKIKNPIEANVIACLWKKSDLFYEYNNLSRDNFSSAIWKLYFQIAKECTDEGVKTFDEFTTATYLNKHPKMNKNYSKYGGYDIIDEAKEYIQLENFEAYINELFKWNTLLELADKGFIDEEIFKKIKDKPLEDVYDYYEANINNIFVNTDNKVKSYNACEDLHKIVEDSDKGLNIGLPIDSSILNEEIGGLQKDGQTYLLGGQSGTGKTTVTLELVLNSMLKYNEQCVMFINEQDEVKIKKELITLIANNHFKGNFQKKRFRQGKFTEEEKNLLIQTANYLESLKERRNIIIIPLPTYTVDTVKKLICKYVALGVKYFILDTFKESANNKDDAWKSMMKDMRALYDLVKPSGKKVFLWATLQLVKSNVRYLTANTIGVAKNTPDVADVLILIRRMYPDEFPEGKKELQVYRLEGKTKIPIRLDSQKIYFIIFIEKNRNGDSQRFQIVAENDLSKNIYKEVGICYVEPDF